MSRLYATEMYVHNENRERIEGIEKLENKIFRTIWGPLKTGKGEFRRDLYKGKETDRMSDTIRKRRITFFGHIMSMDNSRFTKQIFKHIYKSKKCQPMDSRD